MTEEQKQVDVNRIGLEKRVSEFLDVWLKLPPLVRASVAANLAIAAERQKQGALQARGIETLRGMTRRARVSNEFAICIDAAQELFTALANYADMEAVDKGIDADLTVSQDVAATGTATWSVNTNIVKTTATADILWTAAEKAREDVAADEDAKAIQGMGPK